MTTPTPETPSKETPSNNPLQGATAEDIVAQVETGARTPNSLFWRMLILFLCLGWSYFQLSIAYEPIDSRIARVVHLAFALSLVFLAYPAYSEARPPFWVRQLRRLWPGFGRGESNRHRIPWFDGVFALLGALSCLYIWWDYDNIIMRMGLPTQRDTVIGIVLFVLLLEAARRSVGPALAIIGSLFIAYAFLGPFMPEILRHRGYPLDFFINDMYLTDTGIFGVPLGVSTSFVFLFVLFGALLERAGAGRYFIDVSFSALGHLRGGPAKAAILASGMTGVVSGSSISNTVTTGTFTIPLMKKVGLPAHKAGAVEVAASTNGQLMPPVMGAAAFIMADILGMPYLDVVKAALIPAVISYLALIYVVHLEACKLNIRPLSRDALPKIIPTTLRGLHYVIPVLVLLWFLIIERYSPITSALYGIEALVVLMLLQRPLGLYVIHHYRQRQGLSGYRDLTFSLGDGFLAGLKDVFVGLEAGARNMMAIGVATAAAGIVVGVVSITGLVGRVTDLISMASMGSVTLLLILTAFASIILGMGLPTTANYILMASLTAPVIIELGPSEGVLIPAIAAHLFVFYYGILADDTPPVGLAAYAAAALARADPIRTGVQGFTYDMRTAILPFVFIFNLDLLMIDSFTPGTGVSGDKIVWITDVFHILWIFLCSLMAMFAFASMVQGYFARHCLIIERLALGFICFLLLRPSVMGDWIDLSRLHIQILGLGLMLALFLYQNRGAGSGPTEAGLDKGAGPGSGRGSGSGSGSGRGRQGDLRGLNTNSIGIEPMRSR